jgi:hypothetical protein
MQEGKNYPQKKKKKDIVWAVFPEDYEASPGAGKT